MEIWTHFKHSIAKYGQQKGLKWLGKISESQPICSTSSILVSRRLLPNEFKYSLEGWTRARDAIKSELEARSLRQQFQT